MTMLGVLLLSLTVLLLLAVPVAFALVLSATIAVVFVGDIDLMIVPQQVYQGLDSFLLLAIPLFLLAGELMSQGGMTDRLLGFCNAVFGRFRGGLAMTNVASATLMSGISGSAIADTSALGKVLIPAMIKAGYGRGFSAALTAAANVVGPIIPPSITFLMISVLTNLSPLKLFMAAVIPGVLYASAIMLVAVVISRRLDIVRSSGGAGLGDDSSIPAIASRPPADHSSCTWPRSQAPVARRETPRGPVRRSSPRTSRSQEPKTVEA